jgi:carbon monoxide dehydrogenase subunit G/ketosteroid isomerase-like protein
MRRVEQSIEIGAPVEAVFDQVSNFSLFPRWLGGVRRVRLVTPQRTHWTAETATGAVLEWEAETTVFELDRRIAWHSVGGDIQADGEAILEETGNHTTALRVLLGYEEVAGARPGIADELLGDEPEQELSESLARLKEIVEGSGATHGLPQPAVTPSFVSGPAGPIRRARPLAPEVDSPTVAASEQDIEAPVAGPIVAGPATAGGDEYVLVRRRPQPVAGYVVLALLGMLVVGLIAAFVNYTRDERAARRVVEPSPEPTRRAAAPPTPVVGASAAPPTPLPSATVNDQLNNEAAATPTPAATLGPAAEEEARASVTNTLERWVEATNARDVGQQMRFYAPVLSRYYRQSGVARDAVRADKAARFADAEDVKVTASTPQVTLEDGGRTARVRFRKDYEIVGREREERGAVVQELVLTRQGDDWKIVSERDIEVIR